MSNLQSLDHSERKSAKQRRRWAIYGGLAVVGILALAYFDAGEEPIRPITQSVAAPAHSGAD